MLQEIYGKYKESLSKSDHKIFGYLLEHEQELPMVTTAELSAQLGISTATISRFWSKIGYKNLNELKKAVYENQETTPFSRMNAALSQWEKVGISPDMIISRMSLHMEKTFRSVTPAMMDQAVDMILKAEHIYLFAPDASGGLGYIMQYRLMRLGIRLIPIPAGSQIYDFMVNVKKEDLLLLFGYSRLLTEVQVLISHSREIGCSAILFTDLMAGDLLSQADLVLYSCRGEPNDYHSMAVPMLLLDMIIMKTSQALGGGLERARELERLREKYAGMIRR